MLLLCTYPSSRDQSEPVRDDCWAEASIRLTTISKLDKGGVSKAGLPRPHKLLSTRVQLVAYVPNVRKRCLVQRNSQRARTMGFKTLSLTAVGAAALVAPPTQTGTPLTVRHGIFDGVKEAFSQETTILDEDRVTPFDRWLGIDVRSDESQGQAEAFAVPDDFVDSMDESNYVFVDLPKPMGIVFEENDPGTGGVFVASLAEGGAAEADASLKAGDQLVAVAGTTVKGADFDACLGAIRRGRGRAALVSSAGPRRRSTARSARPTSGWRVQASTRRRRRASAAPEPAPAGRRGVRVKASSLSRLSSIPKRIAWRRVQRGREARLLMDRCHGDGASSRTRTRGRSPPCRRCASHATS